MKKKLDNFWSISFENNYIKKNNKVKKILDSIEILKDILLKKII